MIRTSKRIQHEVFTWPAGPLVGSPPQLVSVPHGTSHLVGQNFVRADLAKVVVWPNLRSLDLSNCVELADDDLALLGLAPEIEALNVSYCGQFTRVGFEHICKLKSLRKLDLTGCDSMISGDADKLLTGISSLSDLEVLNLDFLYWIVDAALFNARSMERLIALSLSGCEQLTDDGIAALADLPCLRILELPGFVVTDRGIAALARRSRELRDLKIAVSRTITDESLRFLATSPMLEVLTIEQCHAMTIDGLAQLARGPRLRLLRLEDMRLGDEAISELRQRLPGLSVEHISHSPD